MKKIDAHCHFWSLGRGDYGWLAPDNQALQPIYRDFTPDDLAPLAEKAGIDRYVVVQAAPTEAETSYLLGLAARHQAIGGVVGWFDLADPEAAARIASAATNPVLKGIRPMLQDIHEDDWINVAPHPHCLEAVEAAGLRFDALVLPRHLAPLTRFVQAHPDLPVIIDHAAKPALAAGADDPRHALWREGMATLASMPHVHCKISGLLTEMRPDQCASIEAAAAVLRPVVTRLVDWFGPERLVWGSDWPVLTLAASHGFWVELAAILLDDLSEEERSAISGGNARRFYGLEEETP